MVSLRPLTEDDFETIFYWENLPELWRVSEQVGPFTAPEIHAFMNRCIDANNHQVTRWLICQESEPIGAIDVFDYDVQHKHCGIGIFIAEEQHRRQGFAEEALRNMLLLLKANDCKNVRAIIYVDNHSSKSLFSKVGFIQGATMQYKGKTASQYIRNL